MWHERVQTKTNESSDVGRRSFFVSVIRQRIEPVGRLAVGFGAHFELAIFGVDGDDRRLVFGLHGNGAALQVDGAEVLVELAFVVVQVAGGGDLEESPIPLGAAVLAAAQLLQVALFGGTV